MTVAFYEVLMKFFHSLIRRIGKTVGFSAFILAASALLALCAAAEADYDGYIVRFKDEESARYALSLLAESPMLYSEDEEPSDCTPVYEPYAMYKTDSAAWIEVFEELGLVAYSEPDYYAELYNYDYDAEPRFADQWAHVATNIRAVWDLGLYGNGVTVAVIDSGVDVTNTELAANLLPGKNYVANGDEALDPNDVTDNVGHGTAVAGILAAAVNKEGVVGAAHRAKIVPLRVAASKTFSNSCIAAAVFDAVFTYDADVINMSLGYKSDTDDASIAIREAVETALERGVIVVAAAGNSDSSAYSYPASYEGVVSVASVGKSADGYVRASSSQYNDQVSVASPGKNVLITKPGGTYAVGSGTSYASPYVAAVAALAKSADPTLTPARFMQLLRTTSNKSVLSEGEDRNDYYGYGLLDAEKLILTLLRENGKTSYISPIDVRSGSAFVHISDLSEKTETTETAEASEYRFTVQSMLSNRPQSLLSGLHTLAAGQSAEVDITSSYTAEEGKLYMVLARSGSDRVTTVVTGEFVYGDVNADGEVNVKDNMMLARYLAEWPDYAVTLPAADVNGDGKVNVADNMVLARYLAEWPGYVLPYGN